jgi:hypothetical protein
MTHATEQGHNHNLDSAALNYPCPVNRLRVVSHNRTKHREVRPVSKITFYLSCLCMFTTHLLDPGWTLYPPRGPRPTFDIFLALMVGATGSPAPPPGGPPSTFISVDDERSRISVSTSQGVAVSIFNVDGGHSRISDTASQWAHRRRFLMLMMDVPRSLSAPPRGSTVDIFNVDGRCFRISGTTSQGATVDIF